MSQYIKTPFGTAGNYSTLTAFPSYAQDGALAFAQDTSTLYIFETSTASWTAIDGGGGGGSGTVTSVSVTTANGVSGTVANPTTTPAISLALGAITPSSVNASGTVLGSNLSGTNTGDVTLASVGSSPSANAATISSQVLTLQPFDATHPGVVTASGGGTTNFLRADGTWAATPSGFANPMTTLGDIIYENATPAPARLAGNTTATKNFLVQTGTGSISAAPAWGAIASGDLPTITLTSDVTGAASSGSITTTVAFVGGSSAANVHSAELLANAATSVDTNSTIVKRDGSGNFAATTITAALTGTASGNTTLTPNNHGVVFSGSANVLTVLAPDASTSKVLVSGGASADPSWSLLTNSNLSGSAAITNANLATMAGHTYKGNNTGSSAVPADITSTQLTADLNQFTTSLQGLVPGSGGGTVHFLRADGSWVTPASGSLTPTVITTNTTLVAGNRYICNSSSQLTLTLPTSSSVGDEIAIIGLGTGGWLLQSNSAATSQMINIGGFASPTSSSSTVTLVTSSSPADALDLFAVTANTVWNAQSFIGNLQAFPVATGGTITTVGDFKVHTFTSSGTFQITAGSGTIESLVVAGGGGGGNGYGGGGGAGGMIYTSPGAVLSSGSYAVTVGSGGAGGATASPGSTGANSVFAGASTITALGGGGGGGNVSNGSGGGNGGSGGGAGGFSPGGGSISGGTGTGGQGSNGGNGNTTIPSSGGGGGAGGSGGTASSTLPGNGGLGLSNSITGSAVFYASGGGGCDAANVGSASAGGGAAGATGTSVPGNNATVNTGGGGGGSWYGAGGNVGGNGGSGIVILKYRFQ